MPLSSRHKTHVYVFQADAASTAIHAIYQNAMVRDEVLFKSFGGRVRSLRQSAGLSQEALAELCELDRTYVGGIERGERNPSLRNIARLATALGVSLGEIMQGVNLRDSS